MKQYDIGIVGLSVMGRSLRSIWRIMASGLRATTAAVL